MYQIDFKQPIHVFFIGIGGISMSGLADILLDAGFKVSGSDSKQSPLTEHLASRGATIYIGQNEKNITDNIDLIVFTAAIQSNNPEILAAKAKRIPLMSRAVLLGQIMKNYKTPIAISGTHGKTTTTSMVSEILLAEDTDPTLSIGGILKSIGGNIRVGKSDYFVTEACEYTNSFLSFFPKVGMILNIEEDHLDFFKDLDDIRSSFHEFAKLLPEDGYLIINSNIERYEEITKDLTCNVITFGSDANASIYSFENAHYDEMGRASYTLLKNNTKDTEVSLGVVGEHNVLNSLAAIALSDLLGLTRETVLKALKAFEGTDRRFEFKGELNGITILDDYAHHPTEIEATLKAAGNYPHKNIWCVFQPHTYTRTKAFLEDFAKALSLADRVVLADIYAARETDTLGISSKDLQEKIQKLGTECYYFPSFDEIEKFLLKNCINGDLLITMGAGDVVKIGENLLSK